jgi:hypothetical protein
VVVWGGVALAVAFGEGVALPAVVGEGAACVGEEAGRCVLAVFGREQAVRVSASINAPTLQRIFNFWFFNIKYTSKNVICY